ncbi:hypothetical protein TEA_003299 [Camellia sinensis var. sinensis]|uniref:DNA2/NAM7 helicase-like C-terminal domain-containing protein n=1 Tax=Camellia sinensis var. sinensis TaxID=542762 RepID=A0A4S4D4A4_CAMSN|nr:hypothetical protein TEA_003299 [Camellia sinensis var. sinensis]
MMGSSRIVKKKKTEPNGAKGQGLIDVVFSWSLADVLNKDLYKNQVKQIPMTFSSTEHYMKSFINPLIEETHANLFSSLERLSHAPFSQVLSLEITKDYKPPKDLFYKISLKRGNTANDHRMKDGYDHDKLIIRSSKPIAFYADKEEHRKKKKSLFVVETDCTQCDSQENDSVVVHNARNAISSFNLDDSQKAVVLSCLDTRECHHQISVKLIWGPPGTGKTKTLYLEKEDAKNYKDEGDNEDEEEEIFFGIRKVNNNQDNEGDICDQDLKDMDKRKIWKKAITVGTLLHTSGFANEGLREVLNGIKDVGNSINCLAKLSLAKTKCLEVLKFLHEKLSVVPCNVTGYYQIRRFCLHTTCLIFCTASSSVKLHTEGMAPLELLVIDEAAQLKECEFTIPLQLFGLRHAILIGDERQLPAMVQSEICKKADFGRSLFERLVLLGHKKHLLEVQYRMDPSISLYLNREFYDKKILDGLNVKEITCEKRFLQGKMFGSYSFINVAYGKEDFDDRHSRKNMVEVAVIVEIVATLFKKSVASKQKVRVGCISAYKAKVFALQHKLEKTYSTDANSNFSVSVRSVDGFQGGEEDVIIISTVRCNGCGSVGFLSNRQRTNVALTKDSVGVANWIEKIINEDPTYEVVDKIRCRFSRLSTKNKPKSRKIKEMEQGNEKDLDVVVEMVVPVLGVEEQGKAAVRTRHARADSAQLSRSAAQDVCFSDDFKKSMARIKNVDVRKEVLSLLEKLSSGWRLHHEKDKVLDMNGTSSELLELDKVNGLLNLAWSVDIVKENSEDVQVLKVWDILPLNLAIPVTWPADSSAGRKTFLADDDHMWFLESQVASLTLCLVGGFEEGFRKRKGKVRNDCRKWRFLEVCSTVGSVVIVIRAPQEQTPNSVQEIWTFATQPGFGFKLFLGLQLKQLQYQ